MRNIIFVISVFGLVLFVHAQDSVRRISQVDVLRQRENTDTEIINRELLLCNPFQSYASTLQKLSGIFIKSQGPGSLSTPAYKGLGTMHIPILLDGQNLQSSMNGNMDLTLLSSFHFSRASFSEQKADDPGTRTMGPAITLGHEQNKGNSLSIYAGSSNLLDQQLGVKTSLSGNGIKYHASGLYQKSPNQYSLRHYDSDLRQQNADIEQMSLYQNLALQRNRHLWQSSLYLQKAERGIPGPLHTTGDARQRDINALCGNSYTRYHDKFHLSLKNSLRYENIGFRSAISDIDASSRVWSINSLIQADYKAKKDLSLYLGLANDNSFYQSGFIRNSTQWYRNRLFYGLLRKKQKLESRFENQWQFYENRIIPAFEISSVYAYRQNLFGVEAKKVFRLPTLNEMYWYEPGYAIGNPDIKPENGYRLDLHFRHNFKNCRIKLAPFGGFYENLVVWQGFSELQAENIQYVLVRGIELTFSSEISLRKGKLGIQHNQHWVRSTYFRSIYPASENKQLIYTPELTANLSIYYSTSRFSMYINQQFVGRNYYTSDNSAFIDPYYFLEAGGRFEIKKFTLGVQAENLLNQAYFTVLNRAMPGTVIRINLNYNINLKK